MMKKGESAVKRVAYGINGKINKESYDITEYYHANHFGSTRSTIAIWVPQN